MLGSKLASSPIEMNHRLEGEEGEPMNREKYQRLVGKLIYFSHTRPDIAHDVSVASQFMHNPFPSHLEGVFRILRYLKSTARKGILFK